MPSIYSTSVIPQGIPIYANATLFPPVAQDGEQAVAADTNTLYIYDSSVPGWQAVANPGAAIAIDALTGEVTATGPGVVAATISAGAVTNAKLAAMADNTVKGNKSGAPASPSDLALSSVTEAVSSVLTISNGSKTVVSAADLTIEVKQSSAVQSGYLSSTDWSTFNSKQPAGNYITALTGEVTATGPGSVAATIAANAVTNAKLAQMAANTIKGNNTAGLSDPLDLTTAQTTAMLDVMVGDSGTGGTKGLVPAPVAGDASKYLRGDATWQTISLLPAYSIDKVLYSTASAAEWRTVGTGSTDSSYPTGTVILGRSKPSGMLAGSTYNCVLGDVAGNGLTTGSLNTILGYNAGGPAAGGGTGITTGSDNILVGNRAGAAPGLTTSTLTTQNYNICIGSNSYSLSNYGVAIGYQARTEVQGTGDAYNIAIGYQAIAGNTNYGGVIDNISIGRSASNYAATRCIAIGKGTVGGSYQSGSALGADNVVMGYQAAVRGTSNSVVIGANSGKNTLDGNNNTVVGADCFNSASLTTAFDNVIIGKGSGKAITVAQQHVIIGASCGTGVTSAYQSVLIGDHSAGNYNGIVAIGWKSVGSGVSGDSSVRVGFRGAAAVNSVSIGDSANAGSGGTVVGYFASANATNSVAVGISANAFGATNSISIGNTAKTVNSTESIAIGYLSGGDSNGIGNYNTSIGAYAGGLMNASATRNINLGRYAGYRSTTQTDELFIDNQDRATYGAQQTKSIIYGVMSATETSQTLTLNAQVNLAYGERHAVAIKTATPISVAASDYTIAVDTATIAGASAVNLPAISAADKGRVYVVKDLTGSAATNNITVNVAAASGNLIDGASSQTISVAYGSLTLQSDGSNRWMIL